MGVDVVTSKFLIYCKSIGVDFSDVTTLGRQSLYVEKKDLAEQLRYIGIAIDNRSLDEAYRRAHQEISDVPFAEEIFKLLGAHEVRSVDASQYEGATLVHDMNVAVPRDKHAMSSVVFDGGTLEHIFNFPIAIDNCMKMVRKGGYFISVAPVNNFCGHGFYQFSPELFFRVFCNENGFEVKKVFLVAERPFSSWYEMTDPAKIGRRIALRNQVPTFQLFVAKKIAGNAGLQLLPQQSDYASILWQGGGHGEWTAHGDAATLLRRDRYHRIVSLMPLSLKNNLKAARMVLKGALTHPFSHKDLRKFHPYQK